MINILNYIKLINLVDYNLDTLENSLNYTLQKDDLFLVLMQVFMKV